MKVSDRDRNVKVKKRWFCFEVIVLLLRFQIASEKLSTTRARFEIERKLRDAKRREQRVKQKIQLRSVSASERSLDRRKTVEKKALGKKMSALEDLKARRERKQGASMSSFVLLQLLPLGRRCK